MKKNITIIIADDHTIIREGLAKILESEGFKVIAQASNGNKAISVIKEHKPDAAVLDINMPEKDGLAVLKEIRKSKIETKAIMLTAHDNEKIFNTAMDAGAYGYLLKEDASSDLTECLHKVIKGEYYISPAISNLLINRNKKRKEFEENNPGINSLSETERTVLKLIADTKSTKEIAEDLFVSERTVEKHREHIGNKLGIHGSNAILKFALDNKSNL